MSTTATRKYTPPAMELRLRRRRPRLQSWNVLFTAKDRVELRRELVEWPGPGHVLVETRCSLVSSGTERTCLERRFAPGSHWDQWVTYPFRPGYSAVGTVRAVGKGVDDLQEGDRVASHGAHAQYLVVAASDTTTVPETISDEEAAWFAIACIAQIATRNVELRPHTTVVVIGAGILGQLTVQYARLAGAGEVVSVGRSPFRLAAAASHGATRTIALGADASVAGVRKATAGRGADAVFDVSGNPEVFPHALRMTRRFGTVILLGDTGYPGEQRLAAELVLNGLRVVGAHFDHARSAEHAELARRYFAALERREVRVGDLITHRVHAREAVDGYATLSANGRDALGVVLDWTQL